VLRIVSHLHDKQVHQVLLHSETVAAAGAGSDVDDAQYLHASKVHQEAPQLILLEMSLATATSGTTTHISCVCQQGKHEAQAIVHH
jgi:hypothetical protein